MSKTVYILAILIGVFAGVIFMEGIAVDNTVDKLPCSSMIDSRCENYQP